MSRRVSPDPGQAWSDEIVALAATIARLKGSGSNRPQLAVARKRYRELWAEVT